MTDLTQERFADAMRKVAERVQDAVAEEHELEANLKRKVAQVMVAAEADGKKAHNAQVREADLDEDVHLLRINLGVAKSKVAALRHEAKRVEIAFEMWRSRMANDRQERRAYGA